ncbi:hypothetical protein GCM10029992_04670 [Glycomyces albus]
MSANLGVYERSLSMLLGSLVARTPGLSHAVLVSVDGIPWPSRPGSPRSAPTSSPASAPGSCRSARAPEGP